MPIWLSLLSALYLTGVWAILKKRAKDTNDQTLDSFNKLLPSNLKITKSWETLDVRPGIEQKWLNIIINKN